MALKFIYIYMERRITYRINHQTSKIFEYKRIIPKTFKTNES